MNNAEFYTDYAILDYGYSGHSISVETPNILRTLHTKEEAETYYRRIVDVKSIQPTIYTEMFGKLSGSDKFVHYIAKESCRYVIVEQQGIIIPDDLLTDEQISAPSEPISYTNMEPGEYVVSDYNDDSYREIGRYSEMQDAIDACNGYRESCVDNMLEQADDYFSAGECDMMLDLIFVEYEDSNGDVEIACKYKDLDYAQYQTTLAEIEELEYRFAKLGHT